MPYDPWTRSVALSSSSRRLKVATAPALAGSVMTFTRSKTTGGEKCTTTAKSSSPLGRTIQSPDSTSEKLAPSAASRLSQPSMSSLVTIARPWLDARNPTNRTGRRFTSLLRYARAPSWSRWRTRRDPVVLRRGVRCITLRTAKEYHGTDHATHLHQAAEEPGGAARRAGAHAGHVTIGGRAGGAQGVRRVVGCRTVGRLRDGIGGRARRIARRAARPLDGGQAHARLRRVREVIVDTGPIVALLNARDEFHEWTRDAMDTMQPPMLTCEAVLTEASYLVRKL